MSDSDDIRAARAAQGTQMLVGFLFAFAVPFGGAFGVQALWRAGWTIPAVFAGVVCLASVALGLAAFAVAVDEGKRADRIERRLREEREDTGSHRVMGAEP